MHTIVGKATLHSLLVGLFLGGFRGLLTREDGFLDGYLFFVQLDLGLDDFLVFVLVGRSLLGRRSLGTLLGVAFLVVRFVVLGHIDLLGPRLVFGRFLGRIVVHLYLGVMDIVNLHVAGVKEQKREQANKEDGEEHELVVFDLRRIHDL